MFTSKTTSSRVCSCLLIAVTAVALSGCVTATKVPDTALIGISDSDPHPMSVELYLTRDFQNATWEKSKGDVWVLPLGDAFVKQSERISHSLFRDVTVVREGETARTSQVDAVLTPRLVSTKQIDAAWAMGQLTLSVLVEWQLTDSAGKIIWVDTVKGEAAGVAGNVFTGKKHATERLINLQRDLFKNSYDAMAESPEIRAFAQSR